MSNGRRLRLFFRDALASGPPPSSIRGETLPRIPSRATTLFLLTPATVALAGAAANGDIFQWMNDPTTYGHLCQYSIPDEVDGFLRFSHTQYRGSLPFDELDYGTAVGIIDGGVAMSMVVPGPFSGAIVAAVGLCRRRRRR